MPRILGIWVALAAGLMLLCPIRAQAAELAADPANLASVFAAASGGDTIRLAAGDYGSFRGGVKPATVTLSPAAGASVTMAPRLHGASHIAFVGLTIAGADVAGSRDIAFRNSRFTGMTRVDATIDNANILFDRDTFDGIDMCSTCYEGRLTIRGYDNTAPVGVTVSNSHFGNGGQSDGVQVIGGAYGVQIGPGNEFSDLKQGSFSAHVDPIQFYDESHTTVTGNYFHGNSTGIMAPDGTDHAVITNNVFVTDGEYPDQVVIGGGASDVIRHNTFANGARVRIGKNNTTSFSVGETVTDNVLSGGIFLSEGQSASGSTLDYNLMRRGAGPHDVKAKPVFSGGSDPTGYAGFRLAPGSPGSHAASDGTDMGIQPDPSSPGSGGQGGRSIDDPPIVRLVRPKAGRLHRVLSLHAVATDDVGVARVTFWLDGRRVASRGRRPYGARRRVGARLRRGLHTVAARAVDSSGHVTSVAGAIARGRVLRVRVTSRPRTTRGTDLRATGLGSRRFVVRVARCSGGRVRRLVLSGAHPRARLRAGSICVRSLTRR